MFSDPWSVRDLEDGVRSEIPFFVAVNDHDEPVAYVVSHFGADEGEILNLGVAPGHRRRGLALALVEHTITALRERGVRSVYLEVRESNVGARQLYERLGFQPVGVRPGYYRRPTEAAVVLRAAIPAVGGDA